MSETNRSQTVFAVLGVAAAFGILAFSVRTTKVADDASVGIVPADKAKKAPDFELPLVGSSKVVRLSSTAQAMPVVYSFWATWCGPCRMELPHLEELSKKYAGKAAFFGVNADDTPEAVLAFKKENNLTLPMLSDARRTAARDYGVDSLPTLFIVDKQGRVRYSSQGYSEDTPSDIAATLDHIIAE